MLYGMNNSYGEKVRRLLMARRMDFRSHRNWKPGVGKRNSGEWEINRTDTAIHCINHIAN